MTFVHTQDRVARLVGSEPGGMARIEFLRTCNAGIEDIVATELLAAGATIPPDAHDAYLRKVRATGGFKAYEKAHRTKLLATFTPKFTHLVPPELVPIIVEFSFHVGFY